MTKRAFDIVVSAVLLLLLSPVLLAAAAAVTLDSPGGPLFFQERVGKGGRAFQIVKFRTMTKRAALGHASFEPGTRSRVTRIGRLLRRTKVDELPQLFNVLIGNMSMVGPRPEVRHWVDCYPDRWARVLRVRPGITDRASIEFSNEEALLAASCDPEKTYREEVLPRKLDLAEEYVRTRSMMGDIGIVLATVAHVYG